LAGKYNINLDIINILQGGGEDDKDWTIGRFSDWTIWRSEWNREAVKFE